MVSETKSVLIAGAGVAGPALALLLTRIGHKCTIVERAPDFRASGQQIDVAGAGLQVLECMGVKDECFKNRVADDGIKFVDSENNVLASFPASSEAGSLVKELEIMRPDLARVLFDRTKNNVEYLFDDYVASIVQGQDTITVQFAKSKLERTFDLLVAADGLRSQTRRLAFGDSNTKIVGFNLYAGYFSIPWEKSDGTWSRWFNAPNGRCLSLRPDAGRGLTSAYLCQVTADAEQVVSLRGEDQKNEFVSRFQDAGWESQRIVKYLHQPEAEYFYCQEAAQSKSESLVRGRVALIGDAGYCPAPISGQGSSIALIGSYILAGCIASNSNIQEALEQYEKQVRPFVDAAQKLPPGVPWIVNPQTSTGITVMSQLLKVADKIVNWGVAGIVSRLLSPVVSWVGTNEPTLPEYKELYI